MKVNDVLTKNSDVKVLKVLCYLCVDLGTSEKSTARMQTSRLYFSTVQGRVNNVGTCEGVGLWGCEDVRVWGCEEVGM